MVEKEVTIQNKTGLHARPGRLFVQKAKEFEAEVSLVKEGETYNAKSLLKLLRAGVSFGDVVKIQAEGPDAESAVENLAKLLDSLDE